MIQVQPRLALDVSCPRCASPLAPMEWAITGLHNAATLRCERCNGKFVQELPVNCGLFYPGVLDADTGRRCDALPFTNWFLSGMEAAWRGRVHEPVSFDVEELRPLSRPKLAILNTIDHCYGHSVYELFNAQHYLEKDDTDLVALVQPPLRWMVPDGVAQVWTAGVPFRKGGEWNTWLGERIRQQVAERPEVHLCRAFVQADSSDFDVSRFTRVRAFPLEEWDERLERPTVTFIWRTDRFWKKLVPRAVDNRLTRRVAGRALTQLQLEVQRRWIVEFARHLRSLVPRLDFAVAGMDTQELEFPPWIRDLRHPVHTDESARAMCERYGESHLVIGCNGSSLLLPAAHAGAVINLVPADQWAVSAGTFPFRITDVGDTHFRYVMLPSESSIRRVAQVAVSIMRDRSLIRLHTAPEWRTHDSPHDPFDWGRFRVDAFSVGRHFQSEQGLVTVGTRDASDGGTP